MELVGIHTCVQQCDSELALTYLHMDVVLNHFVSLLCKQSGLFPASLCGRAQGVPAITGLQCWKGETSLATCHEGSHDILLLQCCHHVMGCRGQCAVRLEPTVCTLL